MAQVMIKCPKTKKPIPTGMSMDRRAFETSTLTNNSTYCPICKTTHTWSKADAFLQE